MKKTYIAPDTLTVVLGTCKMMAESLPMGDETITNSGDILVKEDNSVRDVNLWDEEW